ncbi:unnamed protein product [Allacma fusca]|uniref:Integrase zinc-binding domain-containing protein n=1 Tax=Allacma fusca TaxID=39272 RepID=A0A8J2JUJ9_9HEXA|nr:unnamed protein product [Allacma fusca]
MYRQILVHPEDTPYQRILWRESQDNPILDFELLTVTYGTSSAPYLATRTLQQLAQDEKSGHPIASQVLMNDFYVDDLLSGARTPDEAIHLKRDLTQLLNRGGFNIRKWASNDNTVVMSNFDEDNQETTPVTFGTDDHVMTLGLRWLPVTDVFTFKVKVPKKKFPTKRHILSEIAKVYDPLGWLTPTTIKAKILLQSLWKLKLSWDDFVPEKIEREWFNYQQQLSSLEKVRIPRCCDLKGESHFELHGFCDSSESAYAAVVYVRTLENSPQVTIVAAKSKVAPIKQITLPRLELCGAVLLVKLLKLVLSSLPVKPMETRCWTDSTVVLAWLSSSPSRWTTFIANRVSEIQNDFPRDRWNHVKSQDNPADCASRGVFPSELHSLTIWWSGPTWLADRKLLIDSTMSDQPDTNLEQRRVVLSHLATAEDLSLVERYSSWTTLLRVTALLKRFTHNTRKVNKHTKIIGVIDPSELRNAMHAWIKILQQHHFAMEIEDLQQGRQLSKKSHLITLAPFIDQSGVLRVGGRLHASRLPPEKKFPILIPSKGPITQLIVRSEHFKLLHAGPQLLLASLSQRYWILRGRDVCKRICHSCVTCVRIRANTQTQMMGSLPSSRINPRRAFLHTGVDFAGPYLMRVLKGRGHKQFKAYIAIFICFTTRAIHLDLVSDLTTVHGMPGEIRI